jgi:hypothetical protein
MTRSKYEECFMEKHPLPYEELSLPYIRNYVPDFHTNRYILELKGVLERDDAQKISSVYSFLSTDKVYIIAGGKFTHEEELRAATAQFNPTVFKYPDLHYAIAPQMTKKELSAFRLMRGRPTLYGDKFPYTGRQIVAWADQLGIPSLPMSYDDHKSYEDFHNYAPYK